MFCFFEISKVLFLENISYSVSRKYLKFYAEMVNFAQNRNRVFYKQLSFWSIYWFVLTLFKSFGVGNNK